MIAVFFKLKVNFLVNTLCAITLFNSVGCSNAEMQTDAVKLKGSALFFVKQRGQKQASSLLLGTSHTSPAGLVFPREFAIQYIKKAHRLYLEGENSSAADLSKFLLPRDQTLFDVASQAERKRIQEFLDAIRALKIDGGRSLEKMHPGLYAIYWAWMMPARGQQGNISDVKKGDDGGVDGLLEKIALQSNIPIGYLESTEERFSALTSHPIEESLQCLYGFIKVLEDKERRTQIRSTPSVRLQAFNRGDITASVQANAHDYEDILGCPPAVFEREFTQRNKNMVSTIIASLERGEVAVFAPGFAHLGGSYGIVKMLQDSGIEVTRISGSTN